MLFIYFICLFEDLNEAVPLYTCTKASSIFVHLLTVHYSVFDRVREVPQKRSTRILLMRLPTNFSRLADIAY